MKPIKEPEGVELEAEDLTIVQIMPALPGWGAVWGTREGPGKREARP